MYTILPSSKQELTPVKSSKSNVVKKTVAQMINYNLERSLKPVWVVLNNSSGEGVEDQLKWLHARIYKEFMVIKNILSRTSPVGAFLQIFINT